MPSHQLTIISAVLALDEKALSSLDLRQANALLAVKAELDSGAEVTICSASPVLVRKTLMKRLGIKLIGTDLSP